MTNKTASTAPIHLVSVVNVAATQCSNLLIRLKDFHDYEKKSDKLF